jgi:crossover junction endodeoxyribonuclease RuvC
VSQRRPIAELQAFIKPQTKRLLFGIDPGTVNLGWGAVEDDGVRLRAADFGVIRAPAKKPLETRLAVLFAELELVLARVRPTAGAIEESFAGTNPKAAISMGEGRGIALLALARTGIPIRSFSPTHVKKAVTGTGGAAKPQVAAMIAAILGLPEPPKPTDVTDALGVAVALAHETRIFFSGRAGQ